MLFRGYRPGSLIIHDRFGIFRGARWRAARMIAGRGYGVFAEGYFSAKAAFPKLFPEMMDTIAIYDKDRALMRAQPGRGRVRCAEGAADE